MKKAIHIDRDDIFEYLKISCQTPQVLEGAVICKIVQAETAKHKISVTTQELQQGADDFRLMQKLHTIQDTQNWLGRNYLSLDDFEQLIYTNTLSKKLAQHLFSDRVEAFFHANQLDYTQVAIYEVSLDDEDLAMELFCALQEGEISFHEVARQYIRDPFLRRAGGYQGILNRQQLAPEIASAVFAANPPQFIKPILTSMGVHLILVEEIIEPELNEQTKNQIINELFAQWLQQKMQTLEIITELDTIERSPANGKGTAI
ncbi:MAG: peptidylprolyl isomerase [Pleurocapsa sp.]